MALPSYLVSLFGGVPSTVNLTINLNVDAASITTLKDELVMAFADQLAPLKAAVAELKTTGDATVAALGVLKTEVANSPTPQDTADLNQVVTDVTAVKDQLAAAIAPATS